MEKFRFGCGNGQIATLAIGSEKADLVIPHRLLEIGKRVLTELEVDHVLTAVMDGVIEICGVERGMIVLFDHGIPVRARLTVRMKQFSTARDESRGQPPGDPEKVRIVKEGDRLYMISAEEYGNPHLWRHIAEANNIVNPRILKPGQTLIIPALE